MLLLLSFSTALLLILVGVILFFIGLFLKYKPKKIENPKSHDIEIVHTNSLTHRPVKTTIKQQTVSQHS